MEATMRELTRYIGIFWFLAFVACSPGDDAQEAVQAGSDEAGSEEITTGNEEPSAGADENDGEDAVDTGDTDDTVDTGDGGETGDTDDTVDTGGRDDTTDTGDTSHPDEPWANVAEFIEEQRALANIPGVAVAVTRPGEVVWAGGFGLANIENNLPVTAETPFMLASVSKTLTATAVMHAQQSGVLHLDDPIDHHLPFVVDNPRVSDEVIQVRHLVSHTSGIRDNWSQMPYADGDSPYALGDYLEGYLVSGGDWFHPEDNFSTSMPGMQFEYGNIATALAGFVVESATSRPFDDYCDEHIFDALALGNTGWHLSDFDPDSVAMPYRYENSQHVAVGHYGYPDYPDGQLRSSVADLARFLAAVSNEGRLGDVQILTPESVAEMLSLQYPGVDSTQCVFWYELTVAGRNVLGHGGSDNGVATQMVFSPESGMGVIMMFNTGWGPAGDAPGAIASALFDWAEGI